MRPSSSPNDSNRQSPQAKAAAPETPPFPRKGGVKIALLGVLLCSALGARFWHDRHSAPASSAALSAKPAEVEQRARTSSNDLEAQLAWGNLLHQQGRREEAMGVFANCAHLSPRDARSYSALAALAMEEERWDVARVNLREALKCNPADADLWHALGGLYLRAHKWAAALDAYTHATQVRPNDAAAWRQRGMLEMQTSLAGRGHESLARAVALDPHDLNAQYALGLSALGAGQLEEAKKAFQTVLAFRSNDTQAQIQLVNVALQLDPSPAGLERALKQLRPALDGDTTGTAHVAQGRILLLQHKYSPAIAELQAGLAADKNQPAAYVYLSQAYAGAGQSVQARQASAQYQKLTAQNKARMGQTPARETAH